jgi:hypothetical protein
MKRSTFSILALLFTFVMTTSFLCSKESDRAADQPCDDTKPEYLCWNLSGTNYSSTAFTKFLIANDHLAFRDQTHRLYFDIESPVNFGTGHTYNIALDLTSGNTTVDGAASQWDFDLGIGDGNGVGVDTIYTTGTFVLLENTPTYIRGTFTASGARRYDWGSPTPNSGTPVANLELTAGYFKMTK